MNRIALALCASVLLVSSSAQAQNAPTQISLRATLAPPYRAIADSVAIRLAQTYTGGEVSYFKTDAEARSFVMGPSGDAGLSKVHVYRFRAHGAYGVASFSLNDDPSDHGGETGRTVIFDSTGHVMASDPHDLQVKGVKGSVITTDFGAVRWNGKQWVFPKWTDRRVD